jgi:hypothetical protein
MIFKKFKPASALLPRDVEVRKESIFDLAEKYAHSKGEERKKAMNDLIERAEKLGYYVKNVWCNPIEYGQKVPSDFLKTEFGKAFDAWAHGKGELPAKK